MKREQERWLEQMRHTQDQKRMKPEEQIRMAEELRRSALEEHYQWPISMEPPVTETKKWDESFWGKSPRCLGNPGLSGPTPNQAPRCIPRTRSMRRRRFCPPPSNHFPRVARPQWTPGFHNFDYKWNQGVAEKPRFCSSSYDHDYDNNYCNSDTAYKKRSCPKRDKSRKLCTPSSEQYGVENEAVDIDYFPIKSPQINGPEYVYHGERYGGPSLNESAANGSEVYDYSQLGLVTDIAQNYGPEVQASEYHQVCSRTLMNHGNDMTTECTTLQPEFEDPEKNPGNYLTIPGVDGKLGFIDKETISEFLGEISGLSVPLPLNGSQSYEILLNDPVLENLQGETESAVRNLELLYPSIAFTSEQQTAHSSELSSAPCATPTFDQTKVVEPNVQSSVKEYDPTLILKARNQSSSATSDNTNQAVPSKAEGIGQSIDGSSAENSSELLPSMTSDQFVTQESITSLIQQNQLLTDFISQVMSGTFEFEKDLVEEYQISNETLPDPSGAKLVESETNLPKESLIQTLHPNLEIVPFEDPNLNETVVDTMGRDEEVFNVVRKEEPSIIASDIVYNCDSSDFDVNSCMDVLNSNDGSNHEETTLSSFTNYIVEEPDLDFSDMSEVKSIFDTEEMLSLCVAPNSILKEQKRPRKRIKKVVTNVQVKTKIRRKKGSSDKTDFPDKDEEEVVRSICETSMYTSDLESKDPIRVHCDAQTQTSIEEELKKEQVDKKDVETQWIDDDGRDRTGLDDCETLKSSERIPDLEKEHETNSSCRKNTHVETDPQECSSKTFSCSPEVEDSSSLKASVQEDVDTIAQEDSNTSGTSLKRTVDESAIHAGAVRGRPKKQKADTDNSKTKHHHILKPQTDQQEYSSKTFSCSKVEESSSLKTSVREDVNTFAQDPKTSGTHLRTTVEEGEIRVCAVRDRPKNQKMDTDISKITKHRQNKCEDREGKSSVPKSNGLDGKRESPHELRLFTRSGGKSNDMNDSSSSVARLVLQAKRRQLKSDPVTQETPKHTRPGISTRSQEKRTRKKASPISSIVLRRKRASSLIPDDPPFKRQRMRSSKSGQIDFSCENLGLRNSGNNCDYLTPRSTRILRKHIHNITV